MKRILIFVVVGLVMFGAGFGGGLVMGRSMAASGPSASETVPEPGPIVSMGEFTSNLAGSGRHVISFSVSLEAANTKAAEMIASQGWMLRIKNAILLIVKDKVYEDLTSAEGAVQLADEIRRNLNAQLPENKGEPPIVRVLFETFVLQ